MEREHSKPKARLSTGASTGTSGVFARVESELLTRPEPALSLAMGRLRVVEKANAALERELQRAQQERQEALELARRQQRILAEVAHELRSPLASLGGWLRMLTQAEQERGTRVRALVSMTRGVRALARMADDLCDHARFEQHAATLDTRVLNVVGVLIDVLEDMRPLADLKRVAVLFDAHPYTIDIPGDPARLQQVFRNLIGNAIKFTPEDGVIKVKVRAGKLYAVIAISDTGRGLARESLTTIFKPFSQVPTSGARGAGLGLGLSIALRLVELHGGTITAESEGLESGATFRVSLPRLAAN
jgi:signal transduction histidine kinase